MLLDPCCIHCGTIVNQAQGFVWSTDELSGHRLQHLPDLLVGLRDSHQLRMLGKKLVQLFLVPDHETLKDRRLMNPLKLALLVLPVNLGSPSI